MKSFFIFKKLLFPTLAISGISISNCKWNLGVDKTRLSLVSKALGTLNYALERDSNPRVLRALVEPLMVNKTPTYFKSYLTRTQKMVLRKYNVVDQPGNLAHGIDFDPSKLKKNSDGYWDVKSDNDVTDIILEEGAGWRNDPDHEAGAADILVELDRERPRFISSENDKGFISEQYSRVIRLHIRDNLRWSNGEPVTPADYVTTMKYILDPTHGSSLYTKVVNDLKINNASKCYSQRAKLISTNPGMTGDETWAKAEACRGYVMPKNDKNERISNFGFGVRDIGNNWLELEFETGRGGATYLAFGNPALLPMNQNFINSLPRKILDYGLKKEYFLSNGAMELTYFRPDYKLSANKNFNYWNAENTFSSGLDLRLVPDTFSQVNLFRNGYISEIDAIPPEFLPVLSSDHDIARLIKRGAGANIVSMIIFSPSYLSEHTDLAAMNDPDFRRALYYGLNRVETLDSQNLFGVFPSGLSFPSSAFRDYPNPSNDNLYTLALNEKFRPDYPGEPEYSLANINSNDRVTNKYGNFLGNLIPDNSFKPDLAKKFMKRWVEKYDIKNPKLPFEFASSDEALAITLKSQWENLFHEFGFKLDLIPRLQTALDAKILVGRFASTLYRYNMLEYGGRSSFNWFMPFTTTTLSGDRRFANLTLFNGDTAGAYARRLAVTDHGRQRLKELGFNPDIYNASQAGNFWKVLQSLDDYTTFDNPKIKQLPRYGDKGDFHLTNDEFWEKPQPLAKPQPGENYIFRTGLKVSSNANREYFDSNLYILNPLHVNRDSGYGIFNGNILAKFFLCLEKLIRDGAFSIPINSYSGAYFANRIIGQTLPDSLGLPGNIVHAYRFDADLTNADHRKLPGEEFLTVEGID